MFKLGNWLVSTWYPMLLGAGGALFLGLLLWFQLDTLTPGFTQTEIAQSSAAKSLSLLTDNPLNLPYKLIQFTISEYLGLSVLAGRITSAVIGFAAGTGFFIVLSAWYTQRVAALGTLILVCSPWFLQAARSGTHNIVYVSLILAVAGLVWMQSKRSGTPAVAASLLLVVWLLYIPGMIWFVVPALWWQSGRVVRFVKEQNVPVLVAAILVAAAVMAPLILGFAADPALLRSYAGLPAVFPGPLEIIRNIANVPVEIFFRGPDMPARWLGRLPLIDWFTAVMFVIGGYAYFFKRRLDRTKFIAYIFVAGTLLAGLDGPVDTTILLPFVYLLAAGGIALMLQQWFTVFPRNPLARTTGGVLMTLAVLMSAYYGINQYFIAWPNAPETKTAFSREANTKKQQ